MICPRCGLNIESPAISQCPRCGQPLHATAPAADAGAPAQAPGTPPASGGDAVPLYPFGAPPAPLPPPPGSQPAGYPAYPPPYGTGYGPPAPPAPPSQPMYGPGYYAPPVPPGYAPPWAAPGMFPPPPALPRKRSPALLIAGIAALVLILLVALAAGSIYIVSQRTAPQASATPTAPPTPTPIMPGLDGRTLLVNDPLMGDAPEWPNDTHCFVRSDGYHVRDGYFCWTGGATVSNATISVQGEQFAGSSGMLYGIAFRILHQPNHFAYYFFGVSASGSWTFGRQDNDNWIPIIALQSSAEIHTGLQSFTQLTVNATGSHFVFYIGQTQVGTADDSTLIAGDTGLTIYGPGEGAFTNFMVAN